MSISRPVYSPVVDLLGWFEPNGGNPFKNLANGVYGRGMWYLHNEYVKASNVRFQLEVKAGSIVDGIGGLEFWVATSLDGVTYSDRLTIDNFDETRMGCPYPKFSTFIRSFVPTYAGEIMVAEWELGDYMDSMPRYMGFMFFNQTASYLDSTYNHKFSLSTVSYENV